jgi:hypothetical protein
MNLSDGRDSSDVYKTTIENKITIKSGKMAPIYCLIDRSGSMSECIDDTIGGFNTFVKNQDPETVISLTLFDHETNTMYKTSVKDAPILDKKTFVPRGSTALLDSIGYIIKSVPSDEIPVIVILTDGQENSSKKYTKFHINDLITEKKKLGWNFVFLAANQDAIESAGELGIPADSSLTFETKTVETALRSASEAIRRQRGGRIEFSQLERTESAPTKA